MSSTLTYGHKLPTDGDRNFWDDLESNISRDDSHDHDGVSSKQLKPKNFSKDTGTILSASWAAVVGQPGTYKQTVTLPAGYSMSTVSMQFLITSSGYLIGPTVEKVSTTTYDVYINDNSVGLTVIYG